MCIGWPLGYRAHEDLVGGLMLTVRVAGAAGAGEGAGVMFTLYVDFTIN